MRRIGRTGLLLGLGLFAGCEALPEIEAGTCGNKVLEKKLGEDCDSAAKVAASGKEFDCIVPGADVEFACHYRCLNEGTPDAPSYSCPDGMSCGADLVCRKATGVFAEAETLVTSGAMRLQTANFDGDEWLDLVAVRQEGIAVHYLEEDARWDSSFEIASTPTVPSVMHRASDPAKPKDDGSDLPALVINVGTGLAVLTGRPERTLLPKFYDAFKVSGFEWFIAADALSGQVGDELLVIGDTPSTGLGVFGTSFEDAGEPTPLQSLSSYSGIEGLAAVAKLHTQEQCESIALMFQGRSEVSIFSPCSDTGWNTSSVPIAIPLPDGRKAWGGVFVVHLNDDVAPDLIVGSQALAGGDRRLEFYFANPDPPPAPRFYRPLDQPQITVGDRMGACNDDQSNAPMLTSFPLAIGDINQDNHIDFIDSSGMLLSRDEEWLPRSCTVERDWVKARIGRFNGDSFPDVAVVSQEIQGPMAPATGPMSVEFQIGAGGGLFNPFIYPAAGQVAEMFAGDFDGDVIDDLVVLEALGDMPGAPVMEDRLNMFFGSFAGGPEEPASLGTLGAIKQIAVGKTVESDGLDDIIIVSDAAADAKSGVKIMPGNTSRRILSPLFLVNDLGLGQEKRLNRPERLCTTRSVDMGVVSNRIVSIAEELSGEGANTVSRASRLWIANLDGNADLSAKPPPPIDIPAGYPDPDDGLLLAAIDAVADEGGQKNEEVVAFFPMTPEGISMVIGGTGGFALPTEEENTGLKIRLGGGGLDAPMLVNDFNGDDRADIALLLEDDPETLEVNEQGVVVFWNDPAGCGGGNTGICKDNRSVLRLSEVGLSSADENRPIQVFDLAFLDVDQDKEKEVAVLLDRGVYLFDVVKGEDVVNGEARPAFVPLEVDADGKPAPVNGTQQLRGRSLAAFDADRDGLEDLIIGTDNEIVLLRAKWVTQ